MQITPRFCQTVRQSRFVPRFGLRTLFAVITVFCICLALFRTYQAAETQADLFYHWCLYEDEYGYPIQHPLPRRGSFCVGDPDNPDTWVSIEEDDVSLGHGNSWRARASRLFGREYFRNLVACNTIHYSSFTLLRAIPSLRALDCRDFPVNLKQVGQLSQLTRLDISNTQTVDEGLEELIALPRLTHLYLDDCSQVTDSGIRSLSPLRCLKELSIRGTNTTSDCLNTLVSLPQLDVLACSLPSDTDSGPVGFEKLIHLRRLCVRSQKFTDDTIAELANLNKLEELDLGETCASGEGLRHLTNPSRLRVLWLDGRYVSTSALETISQFTELRWLSLPRLNVPSAALVALLEKLPNLRVLDLGRATLDRRAMETVGRCAKLQVLNLDDATIINEDIKSILKLSDLRYLSVEETPIDLPALESLRSLKKLWWLSPRHRYRDEPLVHELLARGFPNHTVRNHTTFRWEFNRTIVRPYEHVVKIDMN